jgi:SAM-dependent methyltransferase
LPELAVPPFEQFAPVIPTISQIDLSLLRNVFNLNKYSSEPTAEENTGPAILKMLFARGLSIPVEQAERVFHPLNLDLLAKSGLLNIENGMVRSFFQAQPYQNLIFFSDFYQWVNATDFVLPIGPAGHYLANLTIRKKVGQALDLGCGVGLHSLLAARHSDMVFAIDINPRALALTRLNAALNGIDNVKTREGNYFEPVEGQSFDLIVANLPYVITPKFRHIYSDSELPGDLSIRKRLKEIPRYLTEGGFAEILVNWVLGKKEAWWQPIQQTLADSHSDTWLIYSSSKRPEEYTEMWIDRQIHDDPGKFKKVKREWLKWYRSNHISQIALGAVILRRRVSKRNWFQSVHAKRNIEGSASDQFIRMFTNQDFLITLDPSNNLLEKIFTLQDLKFSPNPRKGKSLVSQSNGLRLESEVHPATRAVLHLLDGQTSLQNTIQTISSYPVYPMKEITRIILDDMRVLLQFGMVTIRNGI